ncbi:hypothetical protein V6N13_146632 [Hibiscus sabdariffa]
MAVRHARMEKSLLWPLLTSASPHSWSHDRSFENIILSNKELMAVKDMLFAKEIRANPLFLNIQCDRYALGHSVSKVEYKNQYQHVAEAKYGCHVLIIDSTTDGFEAGISKDGKNCKHALLAFSLGVKQMICCCNKMDATTPKYLKARYDEIVKKVSSYPKKTGCNTDKIAFVPIFGFEGDNMIERSTNLDWYKGLTLLEARNRINDLKRSSDNSLKLTLQDVYKIDNIGIVPVGSVETSVLKFNMVVTIGPSDLSTEVKSVDMLHESLLEALSRIIEFNVKNVVKDLKRGFIASNSKDDLAEEAADFTSQVIVMSHPSRIGNIKTPVLDCHTSHIVVKFVELLTEIDRRSEKELEKEPKFLKNDDAGMVMMISTEPMFVEAFSNYPPLGRFTIRDMHRTVIVVVIKSVEKKITTRAMVTKSVAKKNFYMTFYGTNFSSVPDKMHAKDIAVANVLTQQAMICGV